MFDLVTYVQNFFKLKQLDIVGKWKRVFDEMAVHTRKRPPVELLLKNRPNEEKEIFNYRLANYEPITYGSMNRAMDNIYRIVNGINYSIQCSDKIKEYIKQRVFADASGNLYTFEMFMQQVTLKRGIEDPNGLLMWLPTGEGLEDDAKPIMPKPLLVTCDMVFDVQPGLLVYKSNECSLVTDGRKQEYSGEVYHLHTENIFYRLEQFGKKSARQFKLIEVYTHNLGEIPAIVLGGDMNAEGYFESYFAPYVAFGNQAIRQFSDWQAIMVTSAFPYTEEFYVECSVQLPNKDSNPPSTTEEEYSGGNDPKAFAPVTQLQPMPKTPYGTLMRKIPSKDGVFMGEAVLPAEVPSKRFIYPDPSVAEYSGKSWERLIEMAEDALHLNLGDANQSGVAKELDKEGHYAMVDKVGNNFFDNLMLSSLRFIGGYLELTPAKDVTPSISRSSSFKIKTEQDLADEIGTLKEKKAPVPFLNAVTMELARKRFNGDPLTKRIFEALGMIDPLFVYSVDEKERMVLSGAVTKRDYQRSVLSWPLMYKISRDMTGDAFMQATDEVLTQKFDTEFDKLVPKDAASSVQFDDQGLPIAPTVAATGAAAVQDTALNGAQVTAMLEIIDRVTAAGLPPEAAKEVTLAAFPGMPPERVEKIFNILAKFKAPKPDPTKQPEPIPQQ